VDEPLEGMLFKRGYDQELDEITALSENSKEILARYQEKIREETGAKTVKVTYNKIFGYYIDVSSKQSSLLQEPFIKKQTLVNHDRFTSPELKEIEEKLLHAQSAKEAIEKRLFHELLDQIIRVFDPIMRNGELLSEIDALLSLSLCSYEYGWTRPLVDHSTTLKIIGGGHPFLLAQKGPDHFITNDTFLDNDETQLMLLTGPNMAGKSTYIRQVALLVILAQMGSFIPAKEAHIGIIDQIFTRIGASDDLSRGQSTFMVEMSECANILHHVGPRSLVILDEIGRGTSTYDGLALAWSIIEYLLLTPERKAKTLFATHYFELTHLERKMAGIVNFHAAVVELDDQITFLYKICKGSATRSYGIHVAQLAHMPPAVISRATQILTELEEKQPKQPWNVKQKTKTHPQMMLFDI
jgi:DNA mismatch repair protein MutS